MLFRRSLLATTLASLAAAGSSGTFAQQPPYAAYGEYCPPGSTQPSSGGDCPPSALSDQSTTPGSMSPSRDQSASPQTTPQSSDTSVGLDQNAFQPQMASPTFNASPTTAATSPQTSAPNMIGDLFGTSYLQSVVITPNQFTTRGTAITQTQVYPPSPPPTVGAPINIPLVPGDPLGVAIGFPGSPVLDTTSSFATVDTQFFAGQREFSLVTNSTTESLGISALNSAYSPGDVIPVTGEVVAPTGPDFELISQTAQAIHDSPNSPSVPPGGRNLIGEDLNNNGILDIGEDTNGNLALDEDYFHVALTTTASPLILVTPEPISISLPSLAGAPGANVGRQKLTENSSPLPQDRVFVNYSFFADTPLRADGLDVHRITPGFETSFFDGVMSIEFRAPFASTLSSDLVAGSMGSGHETEFGNVTAYFKTLLWQNQHTAFAAGMGVAVPTASDVQVRTSSGDPLLEVENESTHVLPFVGAVWNPSPRCFVQGLCQLDIDPVGNSVYVAEFEEGQPTGKMKDVGRPDDATYLFADLSIGYWLFQNTSNGGLLTGFAPTLELHYNRTIEDAEGVNTLVNGASFSAQSAQQLDLFNGVVGGTAIIRNDATVTVAYATPLNNEDKQYNGELRVIVNFLFGGPQGNSYLRAVPF